MYQDINECDTTHICGVIGGTCTNTNGSYTCTCESGYNGGGDATPCTGKCLMNTRIWVKTYESKICNKQASRISLFILFILKICYVTPE